MKGPNMDPCPLCQTAAAKIVTSAGVVVRCHCTAGAASACSGGAWKSWRRNVTWRAAGNPPDSKHTTDVTPSEIEDTPETRTAHIASKIAECAKASKREACDLTWEDFRAYGSIAWGDNSLGIVRRDITRLGGFNAIRDSHFAKRESTEQSLIKKRVFEHAGINRKLARIATDDEFGMRQIEELSDRVFSGRVTPPPAKAAKKRKGGPLKRALILLFGDPHIGSNISGRETAGPSYGPIEEARRAAQCVMQVCDWKPEHRADTGLHIVWGGDMIDGQIHPNRDRAVIAEQQCRAIHVGIQLEAQLAGAFATVDNHCVSGNHDRDVMTNPGRATVGKGNSHATVIYSAIRSATNSFKNITWNIPMAAFATFSVFGKRYYVTHGDTEFPTGSPSKAIPVGALEAQANRLNSSLKPEEAFSVVLLFHHHGFAHVRLDNGVTILVNGSCQPLTSFARSMGIYRSVSSQTMFEAVEGHPVGDLRTITLDEKVDADASLDKIIRPWSGF